MRATEDGSHECPECGFTPQHVTGRRTIPSAVSPERGHELFEKLRTQIFTDEITERKTPPTT